MSAFVVTKNHVDYLISAAVRFKMTAIESASIAGQDLWDENVRSVNHRYQISDSFRPYKFMLVSKSDPVQVLKAIACLKSQSCEHAGWNESTAKSFLDTLASHAISHLPGYETAAWGIP